MAWGHGASLGVPGRRALPYPSKCELPPDLGRPQSVCEDSYGVGFQACGVRPCHSPVLIAHFLLEGTGSWQGEGGGRRRLDSECEARLHRDVSVTFSCRWQRVQLS